MAKLIALGFLMLSVGCSDSGDDGGDDTIGPFCGDGFCSGSETASSCPSDCSAPACSTSPDNCTGETICLAGRCEAALPRTYAITAISVAVPTTRPSDGTAWDPLGGAPDLFIGRADGAPITAFVANQFSASFVGPLDVTLTALGQTIELGVWDDDAPAPPDGAFICRPTVTNALLRSRTLGCSGGGFGTLTATIQPR